MNKPLLRFEQVSFRYDARAQAVLKEVTFSLPAHQVTVLFGPNGCGKTTLLYLTLGWLKAEQGSIWVEDRPLASLTRRERGRLMALVPQTEYVPFEYSVLEYILLGRAPHLPSLAEPGPEDVRIALEALERVGIAHLADHSIRTLSGGERQLVLIARALTQQPRLLLLDEPTAHLDLQNTYRLVEVVRELKRQGITVLMTSHDPQVVLALADQVVILRQGSVFRHGALDEVFTSEVLREVYSIPLQITLVEGKKTLQWL
ncbi:MAG: ABC transporter ATP-binding protein [Anaerolineales bacterium]|nr:ABC transporter ATP-binding protein [Anaerolineales bacterium]MCS7247827.1 ABC transporter ATP-binding protein [Anaerolineales bacterium]MDW8161637.1 ABC transporter ATP-binding protein [Anaerolineales bacterium]MDW8447868.1 ABC transporter ATP-binding protein [Anaerolineales bacterium]